MEDNGGVVMDSWQTWVYRFHLLATADEFRITAGSGKSVLWYAMPPLFSLTFTHPLIDKLNDCSSYPAHACHWISQRWVFLCRLPRTR